MRKLGLAGAACAALAIAAPAREARASDEGAVIVTVIVIAAAVVGTDIAFTAYDGGHVVDGKEVETSWMIGHAIVMPPQAILGYVPMILAQTEKDEKAAQIYGTVFIPITAWANSLTAFSLWSLGSQTIDVRTRFGVSWLIGTNLTLTSGLAGSLWSEHHYAKPWLSIPTIALAGAELAGTSFAATKDTTHRGEWIGLAAWSGTMTTHGLISLIAWLADPHKSSSSETTDPTHYPTPFEPLDLPPKPSRHNQPLEVPNVAPTAIPNGASFVPGVSVFGRF
jgi:hypothetical protein